MTGSGAPAGGQAPAPPPPGERGAGDRPAPTVPRAFLTTGNTERHLMEADALRHRQLGAALLHGTARSWRYRRAVWAAAIAGAVVAAVIVAIIGVANAFERQNRINEEEQRRRQAVAAALHMIGASP